MNKTLKYALIASALSLIGIIACLAASSVRRGDAEASLVAERLGLSREKVAASVSGVFDIERPAFSGNIDWKGLHAIDPDVEGWIYLEDTPIDYPVAKGNDNDFYLHHLIDGSYKFEGTIFTDCYDEDDFKGFHTVLYGHHMINGTMFSAVGNYIRDPGFYDGHKRFELITPEEKYHGEIFTAFIIDARDDIYFDEYIDEEAKQGLIDRVKSMSVIDADDVEVTTDDHIVMLSTCVAAEGYARYVVIGKLVPWSDKEKIAALLSGDVRTDFDGF